jgi:hypothetical protein
MLDKTANKSVSLHNFHGTATELISLTLSLSERT